MAQKILLISVIVASIGIPMWSGRDSNSRRGLTRAVAITLVFNLLYLLGVKYIYWLVQ